MDKKRSAAEISHDEDNVDKVEQLQMQVKQLQEENEQLKAFKIENDKLKVKLAEYEEKEESDEDDDVSICDGSAWSKKYFQLKIYKQKNGDCKVPQSDKQLGTWVKDLRVNRKKGKLSRDRIDKLDKIGFWWGKGYPEPATWDDRFRELKEYHATFGHCNIPVNPDPALRDDLTKWVLEQRKQGKRLEKSQPSSLTKAQWKLLDSIGFKWKVRKP